MTGDPRSDRRSDRLVSTSSWRLLSSKDRPESWAASDLCAIRPASSSASHSSGSRANRSPIDHRDGNTQDRAAMRRPYSGRSARQVEAVCRPGDPVQEGLG